ncbi:hypothetical protein EJ110_NYTH21954 [Nymphaea thermarum]|uniref:Thylakoid soluble phosphoprotein TSP9 n=1 Tax=Nymphaea colorata TaxID=210225 RepID=A0A5K1EAA7_9MAGN|nr:uncharacterized protein LOC116256294 [Nymphaea colorata]KAF3787936.1 hypothetical protein EJ110_NYTH21954 [Nymphaea thermarum]
MASFGFGAAATVASRAVVASATSKTAGGAAEEKGLLDWILGGLQKQDQFYETDPILKKVEEKNGTVGKKSTVSVPASKKKNGGFGGLFAKN